MTTHYMRLLTDVELNEKQKHVWYSCVNKFLGVDHATQPTEFLDTMTNNHAELEGDDDFPFVYVVYLSDDIDQVVAEQIVTVWDKIYPRDYEIESSAEFDSDCDCDIEIDEALHSEIQRRASKFLHNRWVDQKLHEGWRFGISTNNADQTSPKMRDWDSLNEDYRSELEMTLEQATDFIKKWPHLFV
jgi:hypothetical protein